MAKPQGVALLHDLRAVLFGFRPGGGEEVVLVPVVVRSVTFSLKQFDVLEKETLKTRGACGREGLGAESEAVRDRAKTEAIQFLRARGYAVAEQ